MTKSSKRLADQCMESPGYRYGQYFITKSSVLIRRFDAFPWLSPGNWLLHGIWRLAISLSSSPVLSTDQTNFIRYFYPIFQKRFGWNLDKELQKPSVFLPSEFNISEDTNLTKIPNLPMKSNFLVFSWCFGLQELSNLGGPVLQKMCLKRSQYSTNQKCSV